MKQITNLIPMTDFVFNENANNDITTLGKAFSNIVSYAEFLQKPLTLSMFVPATDEGVALKEPKKPHTYASENADHYIQQYNAELEVYNKAKENVLFEGFELCDRNTDGCLSCEDLHILAFERKNKTIEDMVRHELKLTPAALKIIYNY